MISFQEYIFEFASGIRWHPDQEVDHVDHGVVETYVLEVEHCHVAGAMVEHKLVCVVISMD